MMFRRLASFIFHFSVADAAVMPGLSIIGAFGWDRDCDNPITSTLIPIDGRGFAAERRNPVASLPTREASLDDREPRMIFSL